MTHRENAYFFRNFEPPHFCTVFHHLPHGRQKQLLRQRARFFIHIGIPRKNGIWMSKTQGKTGSKFKDPTASRTPCIWKGNNKSMFQHCKNSRDVFLYIRAIQGHTGGNVIAPELMGHVTIPYKWKDFLFHRGCSYDATSILKSGLVAAGRERKTDRPSSSHLSTRSVTIQVKKNQARTSRRPRKVHNHSRWKSRQDAANRINSFSPSTRQKDYISGTPDPTP